MVGVVRLSKGHYQLNYTLCYTIPSHVDSRRRKDDLGLNPREIPDESYPESPLHLPHHHQPKFPYREMYQRYTKAKTLV